MSRLGGYLFLVGTLALLGLAEVRSEPAEPKEADPKAQAAKDHLGDILPAGAKLRLGTVRFRHGGPVTSVRYLPDGKTLLSYGQDQTLRYWDAASGKELHAVMTQLGGNNNIPFQNDILFRANFAWQFNPGGRVNSWCLSPDGRALATVEGANNIHVRDLMADKVLQQIKLEQDNPQSLCFSADGTRLAAVVNHANENGQVASAIKLFDVASGKELRTLAVPKPEQEGQQPFMPYAIIFSPDGKLLAGMGTEFNTNNRIRIWDLTADKDPHRLIEHNGTSNVFPVFSPNGKLLAEVSANPITGGNAKLRLWDPGTGKQVRELTDMTNGASTIVFSPDGKVMAAADGANQTIRLFDTATGKEITSIAGMANPPNVLFSPDSRTVAVGGNDQMLHIFEAGSGKELHQIKGYMQYGGNFNGADSQNLGTTVGFSSDGKTLAMTAGTVIRRWSVATGKELPLPGAGHESSIVAVAVSPDGKSIATAGTEGTRLWDAATGQVRRRLPEPVKPTEDGPQPEEPAGVNALAFSPDGKTLAAGEQDGTIRLYDPATGKELRQLTGHESGISILHFAPTGKLLLSAGYDGRVFAWDVAGGKQLRQLAGPVAGAEINPENPVRGGAAFFALAPDGATLVTSGDSGIRLCEMATGKVRRQLTKVAPINSGAFAYGGIAVRQFLAIDGSFVVNDSGNGLAFSGDGRTLATISGSTVNLWDVARGKELRQLGGQGNVVRGVAFAPGGKIVAASSEDGTIRFWDVASGTILAQAEGHRGGVGNIAFSADGQTLTSAGNDTTCLIWDVKRCLEGGVKRARPTAQTVSRLWDRLADDDGEKAGDALNDLIEHPDLAMPLLRDRLQPVPQVDKVRVGKLIANLEDDSFDVRRKANQELEKLAELAEPALQARLADNPSLEVKQRIDRLLEKLRGPVAVADQARALRALEVLETIGSAEARALLEKMAKGTPESRVTQKAKERLELWPKAGAANP